MAEHERPRRWELFESGEDEGAVASCRAALVDDPENVDALCVEALSLARLGRHDEALRVITRAVALRPRSPRVARFAALVHWEGFEQKDAVDAQLRAVNAPGSDLLHDQDAFPVFLGRERFGVGTGLADDVHTILGVHPDLHEPLKMHYLVRMTFQEKSAVIRRVVGDLSTRERMARHGELLRVVGRFGHLEAAIAGLFWTLACCVLLLITTLIGVPTLVSALVLAGTGLMAMRRIVQGGMDWRRPRCETTRWRNSTSETFFAEATVPVAFALLAAALAVGRLSWWFCLVVFVAIWLVDRTARTRWGRVVNAMYAELPGPRQPEYPRDALLPECVEPAGAGERDAVRQLLFAPLETQHVEIGPAWAIGERPAPAAVALALQAWGRSGEKPGDVLGMPHDLNLTVTHPDLVEGAALTATRERTGSMDARGGATAMVDGAAVAHLDFVTAGSYTFQWHKPTYPAQQTYTVVHLDTPAGEWVPVRDAGLGSHVKWLPVPGRTDDGAQGYLRLREPVRLVDVHHLTVMLDAAALCADADVDGRYPSTWSASFPWHSFSALTQEWRFTVTTSGGQTTGEPRHVHVEIVDVEGKIVTSCDQQWCVTVSE